MDPSLGIINWQTLAFLIARLCLDSSIWIRPGSSYPIYLDLANQSIWIQVHGIWTESGPLTACFVNMLLQHWGFLYICCFSLYVNRFSFCLLISHFNSSVFKFTVISTCMVVSLISCFRWSTLRSNLISLSCSACFKQATLL